METAEAIATAAGIATVEVDARWAEVDFGVAEGLTFDELATLDPELASRLAGGETEIDWPDGESAAALAHRVGAAWRDFVAPGGRAVVVSHAGPLRIALALSTSRRASEVEVLAPGSAVRLPGRSG